MLDFGLLGGYLEVLCRLELALGPIRLCLLLWLPIGTFLLPLRIFAFDLRRFAQRWIVKLGLPLQHSVVPLSLYGLIPDEVVELRLEEHD